MSGNREECDDSALCALAAEFGRALAARGWRVTAAESCTGGWIAKAITDVPGSSAWFERGFVVYSDAAKRSMLGVSEKTLAVHGAVSEACAREMAAGALARGAADLACAVTGIAGPDGGSAAKPVGAVWFAWAARGAPTRTRLQHFTGNREAIRRQAVACALEGLLP